MKIICYYNKNLKMSEGKLAAQVGHVCKELGRKRTSNFEKDVIVVLGLRKNKFLEKLGESVLLGTDLFHKQIDLGMTEVEEGTITAFGYIE